MSSINTSIPASINTQESLTPTSQPTGESSTKVEKETAKSVVGKSISASRTLPPNTSSLAFLTKQAPLPPVNTSIANRGSFLPSQRPVSQRKMNKAFCEVIKGTPPSPADANKATQSFVKGILPSLGSTVPTKTNASSSKEKRVSIGQRPPSQNAPKAGQIATGVLKENASVAAKNNKLSNRDSRPKSIRPKNNQGKVSVSTKALRGGALEQARTQAPDLRKTEQTQKTPEQEKAEQKQTLIMKEFTSTEKTFNEGLATSFKLIEKYTPLTAAGSSDEKCLNKLKEAYESLIKNSPGKVLNEENAADLHAYFNSSDKFNAFATATSVITNQYEQLLKIEEGLIKGGKITRENIDDITLKKSGSGAELFITVIQRMPRYQMLVTDYVKNQADDEPFSKNTLSGKTVEKIQEKTLEINKNKRLHTEVSLRANSIKTKYLGKIKDQGFFTKSGNLQLAKEMGQDKEAMYSTFAALKDLLDDKELKKLNSFLTNQISNLPTSTAAEKEIKFRLEGLKSALKED